MEFECRAMLGYDSPSNAVARVRSFQCSGSSRYKEKLKALESCFKFTIIPSTWHIKHLDLITRSKQAAEDVRTDLRQAKVCHSTSAITKTKVTVENKVFKHSGHLHQDKRVEQSLFKVFERVHTFTPSGAGGLQDLRRSLRDDM